MYIWKGHKDINEYDDRMDMRGDTVKVSSSAHDYVSFLFDKFLERNH
jgi:hypothetical protein